jgi:hypothetical protein
MAAAFSLCSVSSSPTLERGKKRKGNKKKKK